MAGFVLSVTTTKLSFSQNDSCSVMPPYLWYMFRAHSI
jgi:hypothetical protein